jgi:hypothetical protein
MKIVDEARRQVAAGAAPRYSWAWKLGFLIGRVHRLLKGPRS